MNIEWPLAFFFTYTLQIKISTKRKLNHGKIQLHQNKTKCFQVQNRICALANPNFKQSIYLLHAFIPSAVNIISKNTFIITINVLNTVFHHLFL